MTSLSLWVIIWRHSRPARPVAASHYDVILIMTSFATWPPCGRYWLLIMTSFMTRAAGTGFSRPVPLIMTSFSLWRHWRHAHRYRIQTHVRTKGCTDTLPRLIYKDNVCTKHLHGHIIMKVVTVTLLMDICPSVAWFVAYKLIQESQYQTRNSSGDKIVNMNLFYDDIIHVEASTYAHWTDFLITAKHLC